MLIEQAFYHLPEILHGSGYQPQEYESGIVGAFSMALLQMLNGRNASNPISCLQLERRYREKGIFEGVDAPRHLRADLFVDTSRLHIASKRLSQYGWRHLNWIESKFLRGQTDNNYRHSTNKTSYVAGHLADLIRLACLVPEEEDRSKSGRYFLHVYDAPPNFYLTDSRPWCRKLYSVGARSFSLNNLDVEVPTVRNLLGNFPDLNIDLRVTNFVIRPTDDSHSPCYWCILTRIDELVITYEQHAVSISSDRTVLLSEDNAFSKIASFVATTINIPPPENTPPPDVEPAELEDDADDQPEAEPT